MLGVAGVINRLRVKNKGNFLEEYFIGSRSMGGFVLAMTIIATYVGASSFIGGPGKAYGLGLGWVLLACIQTPTAFLTLGVLGKKLAIISRRIGAVTIIDFLKKRYESDIVVALSSVIMLIFFAGTLVANFVGGAKLFESVTGLSYNTGLIIFSIVVITYTTIGGFRAVVLTDAIQGCVMLIAAGILFFTLLKLGGGMENIMLKIQSIDPSLLEPTSGGKLAKSFVLSFWVLVGIAILGLPATTVRCMGFKDSKSMHNAMIIGTLVVGSLMLIMHLIGVMGIAILEPTKDIDKVVPLLAIGKLHPILAGIFIGGPLAAIMSTVDSFFILTSATIVKNIYISYVNPEAEERKLKKISTILSLTMGVAVFLISLNQTNFLVDINLFALGGQEAAFFCPIIFGLYWKRANATGAIASMSFGVVAFILLSKYGKNIMGLHQIVPTIILSIIVFIVASYCGKKPSEKVIQEFFDQYE